MILHLTFLVSHGPGCARALPGSDSLRVRLGVQHARRVERRLHLAVVRGARRALACALLARLDDDLPRAALAIALDAQLLELGNTEPRERDVPDGVLREALRDAVAARARGAAAAARLTRSPTVSPPRTLHRLSTREIIGK
mgnify:CR=1 FL=1